MAYVCFPTLWFRYFNDTFSQRPANVSRLCFKKNMYQTLTHLDWGGQAHLNHWHQQIKCMWGETMLACCINTCLLLALHLRINGHKQCLSLVVLFRSSESVCPGLCFLPMKDLSLTLLLFFPPSVNESAGADYPCLVASPCLHVGEVGRERSENIQSEAH